MTVSPVNRCLSGVGLVLLAAAIAGCRKDEEYRLLFSHPYHVTELELDCSDCHGDAVDGRFSRPGHSVCTDCHEDWIETEERTEETCGACHKVADYATLEEPEDQAEGVPAGVFVHTEALAERCADCHGGLLAAESLQAPRMTSADWVRLRDDVHRWGMECSACHLEMDPDIEPASHDETWTRRHGAWGEHPDNACGMCHAEQSCRECHQEMMPDSHNNLWRLKTHGIESAWDRERCLVCHEQDSCDACHSEVSPRSHNAAWERNHCYQCHPSSATGTGCSLCHEGGLDDHPDPHAANWQNNHCRVCHSGSPQAEQCAACHGPLPLPEHENPHRAGWEAAHCVQCHNRPALDGVACAACHDNVALPEHPDPHGAGWVNRHCAQCHEGRGEIKGVSCRECHGGDLIGGHPDPHTPGFSRTHCNQCHESALGGVGCEVCHGNDLLGSHPNPHPPAYERTHCTSCHQGATFQGIRCEVCHGADLIGNHPNPHPMRFERTHCYTCHPGSQSSSECGICHEGAGSVLLHEDFWPPVHDRFGGAADCYDCH